MDWKVDHKLKKISGAIKWLGNGMGGQPAAWAVVKRDNPDMHIAEIRGTYRHGDGGYDWRYLLLNHGESEEIFDWGFNSRDKAVTAALQRMQRILDEGN